MNRLALIVVLLAAAAMIVGCGPVITIVNNTQFPVRAIVSSGGRSEVLSPSPGESSSAEVSEGPYRVTVVPDAEWISYAKAVRQYLNDQLAHADKLTGPQLLGVIRRLKEIAVQMQQYEQAAGSSSACGGKVSSDTDGYVQINTAPNGALVVVCK
jgi:hypothetical protein